MWRLLSLSDHDRGGNTVCGNRSLRGLCPQLAATAVASTAAGDVRAARNAAVTVTAMFFARRRSHNPVFSDADNEFLRQVAAALDPMLRRTAFDAVRTDDRIHPDALGALRETACRQLEFNVVGRTRDGGCDVLILQTPCGAVALTGPSNEHWIAKAVHSSQKLTLHTVVAARSGLELCAYTTGRHSQRVRVAFDSARPLMSTSH